MPQSRHSLTAQEARLWLRGRYSFIGTKPLALFLQFGEHALGSLGELEPDMFSRLSRIDFPPDAALSHRLLFFSLLFEEVAPLHKCAP
jgi:hypothetical protein